MKLNLTSFFQKPGLVRNSQSTLYGFLLLSGLLATSCTMLDTTPVPDQRVKENKAHVGRYYMLPKALITIQGSVDTDKDQYTVDASVTLVADRRHRYFIRWKQNPFYDDVINNLDVDSDGMLTSTNYTAQDQTPQIITDLANTTVNLFKIAGRVSPAGAALAVEDDSGRKPLVPFKYTFDPLDSVEVARVARDLKEKHDFSLNLTGPPLQRRSPLTEDAGVGPSKVKMTTYEVDNDGGGVFYHPPTTIEFILDDQRRVQIATHSDTSGKKPAGAAVAAKKTTAPGGTTGGGKSPADGNGNTPDTGGGKQDTPTPGGNPASYVHVVLTVPDVDQVACYRLGRSFLTKRENSLTFVHGMPTGTVFKNPSSVQAFTGLLSSVSGIAANAVPSLFNVKVNRDVADLQQQKRLIDAQAGLATSQGTLAKALASNASTATGAAAKAQAAAQSVNGDETVSKQAATLLKTMAETQKRNDARDKLISELMDQHMDKAAINAELMKHAYAPIQ